MGTFWKVVIAFFMASLCLSLQAAKAPPAKEPAKAPAKKRGPPINYQDSIMISQLVNDERKASFLKFMMLRQTLLIPLTDLGRQRYGAVADDVGRPRLQVGVEQDRIWAVGIPRRGDMARLEIRLRSAGITWGEVSWHS